MSNRAFVPFILAGFCWTAPLFAQQASDIVVTGERGRDREAVRRLSRAVTTATEGQLARFHDPVCATSVGLPDAYNALIVDRIEADARAAHIAVGGRGCRANVTAIFVRDGKAVLAALNRTDPGLFRDVGAGERRRLLAEDGPVHVLHATEIRSRDGDRLKAGTSATSAGKPDVPYLEVRSASILGLPTRQDINGAVILIDTPATVGKTLQQLADYIAMRVLARTREVGSGRGGDTILTLFDDAAPPPGMTSFDTGYLAALYKGDGTRTGQFAVGAIARSIDRVRK